MYKKKWRHKLKPAVFVVLIGINFSLGIAFSVAVGVMYAKDGPGMSLAEPLVFALVNWVAAACEARAIYYNLIEYKERIR